MIDIIKKREREGRKRLLYLFFDLEKVSNTF